MAAKLVSALSHAYGSQPEHLIAAIGPGICQACYEVGAEVAEKFGPEFTRPSDGAGKYLLDIQAVHRSELLAAGVRDSNVSSLALCTRETPWLPSHRRDHDGRRFGTLVALV